MPRTSDHGDPYELLAEPPTLEEYVGLRRRSGLSPVTLAQGEGAVANSWCFHIADMATLPEHQGRGLGRRVLTWLLEQIDERAPADPYITLNADAPGRPLYASVGFVETAPRSLAMCLRPGATA